jgi:hypothetical protein
MTRNRRFHASVMLSVVLLGAAATSGCVVPVKMKNRIEGPAGTKEGLSKEVLVPGTTTRREVEERYKGFAVDTGIPNLFWGRFRQSSWAVVFGVAGYAGAATGGGRKWNVRNLLITFDDDGTVRSSEVVLDEEFQDRWMTSLAELAAPPLDLSRTVKIDGLPPDLGTYAPTIDPELTSSGVVVTSHPYWISKKAPPLPKVAGLSLARIESLTVGQGHARESVRMGVVLRFTGKTPVGRRLAFWVEPKAAPVLVRWLAQVTRPND